MSINKLTLSCPADIPEQTLNTTGEPESKRESWLRLHDTLFVKQNYQFTKLCLNDLIYLEAEGIHTLLFTQQKKYVVRLPLSGVLERLADQPVVRVHRSYAVHLNHINSFSEHELIAGSFSVPLGRNYREEFLRHFPSF
jgi:two-component system, response regulator PdtaR